MSKVETIQMDDEAGPSARGKPFEVKARDGRAEIFIFDDIGDSFDGTTAKSFAADLKGVAGARQLDIFINSPGGSVFDGVAIFNQLKRHKALQKNVFIEGIAASIASVIPMAGDTIEIASNGFMMIHDPWMMAAGDAREFRKAAEQLEKVRGSIQDTYAARTGLAPNLIADMMADETWMTAAEAVELGFADSIGGEAKMAARFDLSKFTHVPEDLADRIDLARNPPHLKLIKDEESAVAESENEKTPPKSSAVNILQRQRIVEERRRLQLAGRR